MNDQERHMWVDNDEGLYSAWKVSRLPKREFIRKNRPQIDEVIECVTSGRRRPHYLKYG